MKKRLLLALTLLPLFYFAHAQYREADNTEADAIRTKITESSQHIKTLKCDFKQVKSVSVLSDKAFSTGRMLYKATDRLLWQYLTPQAMTMIINGDKVTMKSGNSTNEMDINSNRMLREISNLMMASISGKGFFDSALFSFNYLVSKESYCIILTPTQKKMAKFFKIICMYFDVKDGTLTKIELVEPSDDSTVITIANTLINCELNDKEFEL